MDRTLAAIASFAADIELGAVPPRAVELTKVHLLDTIGCGAGGLSSPSARKITAATPLARSTGGASAYGVAARTTPELAAFVNATFDRCLDFNDLGPAGHPSDMIPGVVAVAEDAGASGADVLRGSFVAYEVATALATALPIRRLGWDMGLYCSAGAAAGMASVARLDRHSTAHAVSLAVVPSTPLLVTRSAPSEWRSAATAHAVMNAAFAVRMAQAGVTGPPEPFEGERGLFEMVAGSSHLELGPLGASPTAVERGTLKLHAACGEAHSAIDAALRLRAQVDVGAIARVAVDLTPSTHTYIGGGRGDREIRWRPPSREVADHSVPYLVANALLDGQVVPSTFADERLRRGPWLELIDRIETLADPTLAAGPQGELNPARVTVELADGTTLSERSCFPYDADGRTVVPVQAARAKYQALTSGVLPEADVAALADAVLHLEAVDDLDELTRFLRRFDAGAGPHAAA